MINFTMQMANHLDEPIDVLVSCNVTEVKDPYGTGDSPTAYDVEDVEFDDDNFEYHDLSAYWQNKITEKAIEEFLS